jgi:hypothetical protein
MNINAPLETHCTSPSLLYLFVGIRYTDNSSTITSGSLRDIPDVSLGTNVWLLRPEGFTYFILPPVDVDDFTSNRSPFPLRNNEVRLLASKIAQLEQTAKMGNKGAFLKIEGTINWAAALSGEIIQGIQLALAIDAPLTARQLATRGCQHYPDHAELRKYSQVLAPPKKLQKGGKSNTASKSNRDWIMKYGDDYRGQWVALKDGSLLGTAFSLRTLVEQVGKDKDILFTKVF